MRNIHVLPTAKPSRLWLDEFNVLRYGNESFYYESGCIWQNIYITNSEEIKEGDWSYNIEENIVAKCIHIEGLSNGHYIGKKIILTTDQDLICDGIAQISEDVFLKIVEQFNKK